jgi:predicted esterase
MSIALFSFLVMIIVFTVTISMFAAGSVHKDVPSTIDVNSKYLFYMHGMIINLGGSRTSTYNYSNILNELAKRGFIVIGEERDQVRIDIYAKKISEQVRKLLAAGVPAKNITVAGHSQGGMITMLVMSMLDNPDIAYVNFAGCGKEGSGFEGYLQFARNRASMARGHLLSAYTHDDKIAGSCKPALDKMTKAVVMERVLEINGGHELFFNPKAEWLDILQEWSERRYK